MPPMRRDYIHWLVVIAFVMVFLLIGALVFTIIDTESGTLLDTHEAPGTIVDLYTISNVRSTKSGNTTIYHNDYQYYAQVMSEGAIYTVKITKHAYYSYYEGQEIILFTYTTKGGISGTIYTNYSIKVLD